MDAVTSFTYIVDNLPSWREQVVRLSAHTAQKHEEFKAEYTRLVAKAKPRRIKSPSICSIHTNDDADGQDTTVVDEEIDSPPDPVEISPFEAGNRFLYAQAVKKRKAGTSIRSGASGPMKFRSKQMVVIYYDAFVQEQLDNLVKAIGGSRNNLRKGRMAYTVSKGLQLPTIGRRFELPSLSAHDSAASKTSNRNAPKIISAKSEACISSDSAPIGEAAFKQVDKDLETCQNFCETAAHQFLRDGDCKVELDTVIQNLDQVLPLAKECLETFKAEQEQEQNEVSSDDDSATESVDDEPELKTMDKHSRDVLNIHQKLGPQLNDYSIRPPLPTTQSAPLTSTEIEVDDDSDSSSIEIDISTFRNIKRAGVRS